MFGVNKYSVCQIKEMSFRLRFENSVGENVPNRFWQIVSKTDQQQRKPLIVLHETVQRPPDR